MKSLSALVNEYMTSVGRGCNLILDLNPDTTGLVPMDDQVRYQQFGDAIARLFSRPIGHTDEPQLGPSFQVPLDSTVSLTRGALVLKERLVDGQVIVEHLVLIESVAGEKLNISLTTLGSKEIVPFSFKTPSPVRSVTIFITNHISGGPTPTVLSAILYHWDDSSLDSALSEVRFAAQSHFSLP